MSKESDPKKEYRFQPLGLMPMQIWLEKRDIERMEEIKSGIKRYIEYDKEIPEEWINEWNFLIKQKDRSY